ncbi:MAG: hypothetical protein QM803_05100 [Rhodocyclaceae bacterium]
MAILIRLLLDHRPGISIWPLAGVIATLFLAGAWGCVRRRRWERVSLLMDESGSGTLPLCVAPVGWSELRPGAVNALMTHLAVLTAFVFLPPGMLGACASVVVLWAVVRCRRCTVWHDGRPAQVPQSPPT